MSIKRRLSIQVCLLSKNLCNKIDQQAGAELCQAQTKLALVIGVVVVIVVVVVVVVLVEVGDH